MAAMYLAEGSSNPGLWFPVALVIAKSLGTVLNPVNKVCVPTEVAEEMARRNARAEIDRRRG